MSVPWTQDELLENLTILSREVMPRGLKANLFIRKIRAFHKKGKLTYESLPPLWWYRLCCCDLRREKYHWWGWDLRSEWAWQMANRDWWHPRWEGHPSQRCVIVLAEQGLGEEITHISCLPDLLATGIRVIWECDPRLVSTFEASFEGDVRFVSRYYPDTDKEPVGETDDRSSLGEPIDCFVPAGNLLQVFRTEPDHWKTRWGGWLKNPGVCFGWGSLLDSVGICWTGRTGILDPEVLARPFGEDWDRINLNYDGTTHPLMREVNQASLGATFDLIHGLDRVVTTTATPAHMAAALGIRTDVIAPPPKYTPSDDPYDETHNRLRYDWPTGTPHPWYGHHVRTWESQAHWRTAGC